MNKDLVRGIISDTADTVDTASQPQGPLHDAVWAILQLFSSNGRDAFIEFVLGLDTSTIVLYDDNPPLAHRGSSRTTVQAAMQTYRSATDSNDAEFPVNTIVKFASLAKFFRKVNRLRARMNKTQSTLRRNLGRKGFSRSTSGYSTLANLNDYLIFKLENVDARSTRGASRQKIQSAKSKLARHLFHAQLFDILETAFGVGVYALLPQKYFSRYLKKTRLNSLRVAAKIVSTKYPWTIKVCAVLGREIIKPLIRKGINGVDVRKSWTIKDNEEDQLLEQWYAEPIVLE